MADVEKLTVTLEANVGQYNADLAQAAKTTAQQTSAMENSFAKLGTFGQRTPQNFDKIASGMSGVGKAALQSHVEQELLNASLSKAEVAAGGVTHAIGAMSTQGMAAFHALRGGSEQLLQGADPFRVLAMEMNNLTYAASGAGGLKGAFSEALGIFTKMLNPVAALTIGLVGSALAVVGLGESFARSQSKIGLALTGVGKSAGITVGQINQIGEAVAKSGDLSTSEASDVATAIASTGRASAESTEKATVLAHAYSLVFNKDLNKSAADLAAAIADPGSAIDALNGRLGAWSANQVELVKNLTLSGDRQSAAKIIIDGLQKSIGDASTKTDFWTRSWNKLSNAISNAITASGKAIDQAAGNTTPEDALAAAQARLKSLQQGFTTGRGGTSYGSPQEIQAQIDKVNQLKAAIQATQKAGDDSRDAADVSNIVKGIDPTLQKLDDLQATITRIQNAPVLDKNSEALRDQVVKSLQSEKDALQSNLALAQQRYGVDSAQLGLDTKANAIELAGIQARTPAQKADIAYRQTLLQLKNTPNVSPAQAEAEAQLAYTKSLTEAQHQLSEAQRDRIYQAGQSVEQAQVENSTIGQSVDVVTTLTQRFQLLAAAQAEAHKNGTIVSPAEIAAMDQAATKLGQLAQAAAALNAQKNAQFDISQLGRDQSEQNVYSTLQSAGLLNNGQIVSAQAKQTAEVLRTKEALSELADTEKTFASTFLHDLLSGQSATKALGDALNAVASKLLDMGIDKLVASSFSGGLGSLFSGFADGGIFVPGMGRQPLKKFAGGGVSNTAAIFGEAGPEAAIPLKGGKVPVDLRMPKVAASAPAAPNVSITIDARNSTPASVDKMNNQTLPQLEKLIDQKINYKLGRSAAVKKMIRNA